MIGPHVETELLAYLDGELGERERAQVEAHLAACPRCAAELQRLGVLQQELDATFDTALSPVRLPRAADDRIRERLRARTKPRPWLGLWRRRGIVAQALLAALALLFALNTSQLLSVPPPAAPQETLVLGYNQMIPGSRAALRVIVRSTADATNEAEPIEGADVVVRIGRTPGTAKIVYSGQTDGYGTADVAFTVPEDIQGLANLIVETSSAGGRDQIVRPIVIARDYKLFLTFDKPAYRPGQTVHLRALALNTVDLRPAEGQTVELAIHGPTGLRLERRLVDTSDFGIAAYDFALPPDAAHGQYTLRAELADTVSERTITVGDYELPPFRVTLETDRTFYAPGERVTGSVQAAYFFGKPVAGGEVALRGYTDAARKTAAVIVLGDTDEEGAFEFAFVLPPSFGESAANEPVFFDLEAEVMDAAGQRSGTRQFLPVAAQPILVSAIPESGVIKPGVENAIYVMTAYADGRPVETTLTVRVEGERYTLASDPYGLAEFRYVPADPAARFEVDARDAQGATGAAAFAFQADLAPAALLLRTEWAAYEVGDTLRAEALVAGPEPPEILYLDVVQAGQTVAALSAPVEDRRATFALDLDGAVVGTLELHAYWVRADGGLVRATRLVIVDAPRQVDVAVSADREIYRPGETAHITVQTAITPTDRPISQPTALGIGVVDTSVYALETLPPGFVRAYFLLEQELVERRGQGLHVPTLLDAEAEVRASQDVAARAAWAGAQGTDFTLTAASTAGIEENLAPRIALANQAGLVLALLPLLMGGVVVHGLWLTGVLGRALRRVLVGILVLFVASPLAALFICGALFLSWAVVGAVGPIILAAAVAALLAVLLVALLVHGWLRRDVRVQLTTGLVVAYLVLGGLAVALAARGGNPGAPLLALIAATFLLALAALATLGQGLVLEGRRLSGWASTLVALLLIPLAICLPFIPGAASNLTRTLGNPALYAGPVGWLTGCAAPAGEATKKPVVVTVLVEKEGETVVQTVIVEVTKEAQVSPPAEATQAPPTAMQPTGTPPPSLPTQVPAEEPEATATPVSIPREPYPLRQVFPETLYWDPEAHTGEDGTLALDLPLADNVTTWRLTALASTREGELGVATYDIVVFQDFFVEPILPATVTQGETVTVTLTVYNYLPQAQTIQIEPVAAGWYTLASPPQPLTLPPGGVGGGTFAIRAEESGDFTLLVVVTGEGMSDAVAGEVTVETP